MPRLETWLEKVKQTKLRDWLNVAEIEALILKKKTPTVYIIAATETGIRSLTIRIDGIAKRFNDGEVVTDLLMDCTLRLPSGEERPMQLKAGSFVPDPEHELGMLSRIFATEVKRDNFLEDLLFIVDINEQDAIEHQRRFANSFFRKFIGGLGGPDPA